MSKPRYRWWGYVKNMIRYFPRQREKLLMMKEQSITPKLTGMPGGGGVSNPTEDVALRELPETEQREYEAVRKAIYQTGLKPTGKEIMKLIKLVYWDRSHTIYGASRELNVSEITAKRWHIEFIKDVAKNYGFLNE